MANIITATTPRRALLTQAIALADMARDDAPLVAVGSVGAVALLLVLLDCEALA